MYPTHVEVRDRRLCDPQQGACFGPEFRNDHEGQQFLSWVAERQRRAELSGPLGMSTDTWDNDRLNDVFREFYEGFVDSRGFLAQIPIWFRPDGNLSAAREPVTPRPPKLLPHWLAWLDRGR